MATPDFERNVHCLLGLPFDAVDLAQAEALIHKAIITRTRCFLSTPNLNFLIACQHDPAFRLSVINSNLVVADGMPIVWLAKLLGIPIRQRVAGSTLFEKLWAKTSGIKIKTYFFGGQDGVARAANLRMNAQDRAMFPGFGSVEAMSTPTIIANINASETDFLVVSLGARKGQAWIVRNLAHLDAPVISHLGAVVNFVAGSIHRAPSALQTLGLEWLWRIKEEPQLWRRYLEDGLGLMRLFMVRVLPGLLTTFLAQKAPAMEQLPTIHVAMSDSAHSIVLEGCWQATNLQSYRLALKHVSEQNADVRINLRQVTYIDSAFLGLTLVLYGHQLKNEKKLCLEDVPIAIRKIIFQAGMGYVLE
jgi:N-acetylglucosaminyldiphosphoundecaprenol N-acetyl-beta-D-mannosaminyltransferase